MNEPVVEDHAATILDENVDPAPQIRVEPDATVEKPLTRRESIAKALEAKQSEVKPETAESRARDQKGRFINKDGTPQEAAPAVVPPPQSDAPVIPRKPMPKAWKQDFAPKWDSLDPDMANFLAEQEAKREQDVMAGVEKYRGLSQYAERLRNVVAPREQALVQNYGSVEQGIDHLFQLSDAASQNPAGFIQWFAQQRGIDLRSLVPQGQPQQDPNAPQGQQMPDLTPFIRQAIQPFEQRLMAQERQSQQFAQERQQAESRQREDAVNAFFSETDADGLKFQVPDDQMDAFAKRVKFLRADNPDWDYRRVLEKSYDELTWTSESLRSKRLEADAKRQSQEMKDKQARELAAKKAAAVSVKGAPGTSPEAQIDPRDRRAVIERQVANLSR